MEGTRRFGIGIVRFQQGLFAVVALTQLLGAFTAWRDAGGLDGWVLLSAALVVVCGLAAVAVHGQVVRVGEGRISWRLGLRSHDLAFHEVAEIRRDPRWWAASQLVTTDGRVLRLPLQPQHGSEVWRLVLGDRTPSPA